MLFRYFSLVVLLAVNQQAALSRAHDHAAIAPYLADDVSSVVYLDLGRLKLPAIVDEMEKLGLIPETEREEVKQQTAAVQAKFDELTKLGARRAYLLVRVSDFFEGPTLVVQVEEAGQAQAVADWLAALAEKAGVLGDAAAYVPREFVAEGSIVVGAGSSERLKKATAKRAGPPRAGAVEALAVLDGADLGWVAFGDDDSRRVVREMFPQLPAPFMEIDGKLLADGLKWIAVTATLPPDPTVSVALSAADHETARLLENSAGKGLVMAKGLLMAERLSGPPVHKERAEALLPLLTRLAPRVNGSQLSITFGDDDEEKAILHDYLPKVIQGAQAHAHQTARLQQFKQIGLAMHNYASTANRGTFPSAASYDGEGRPLLSWRVHLLPYTGDPADLERYKKFRLDEPWDSDHNRALIAETPSAYKDPDPRVRAILKPGETTYAVPVGEGTIFDGREGTSLHAITDGTSNTILAVEVAPERAVVWTKPDDWQVDLSDPLRGVKRADRDFFTALLADGSVQTLQNSTPPEKMRALLTRAGGEPASR